MTGSVKNSVSYVDGEGQPFLLNEYRCAKINLGLPNSQPTLAGKKRAPSLLVFYHLNGGVVMSTVGIRLTSDIRNPFKRSTGIEKLADLVEKHLLTTYGTDSKNPETGCYLKNLVGRSNMDDIEEIAINIDQEVRKVEEQIIALQTDLMRKGQTLSRSEQLQSLTLVKLERDSSDSLWGVVVTYEITNREGESVERKLLPA